MDGGADVVEFQLQAVEVLVQPLPEDLLDRGVGVVGGEPPEEALGLRRGHVRARLGDGVERPLRLVEAVPDRAREQLVEHQEVDDRRVLEPPVLLPVHLERAHRAKERREVNLVEARPHLARLHEDERLLGVDDPARLVGALEQAPEPAEVPALAVRHRQIGDADEEVRRLLHRGEEVVRVLDDRARWRPLRARPGTTC